MLTYDDGFSGGGLATCGAVAAGLTPIGAVEYDPAIADVYRVNLGDHITVAPIQEIDWTQRPTPFWRHMSPVCTRFSQANADGEENELDIAAAQAVVRSIEMRPPKFSLENVWQYRDSESFKMIYRALRSNGYDVQYWHLNAANYGVPQTRKRLILVASRTTPVKRPHPTHRERTADSGQMSMFDALPNWIGWHAAIEDLIPTLPESQFAPWQLERLPDGIFETALIEGTEMRGDITPIVAAHPTCTIKASHYKGLPRAFIVHSTDQRGMPVRPADDPMFTVMASSFKDSHAPGGKPRAFLVNSGNAGRDLTLRGNSDPSFTIAAQDTPPRAFMLDCQHTAPDNEGGRKLISDDQFSPSLTVIASQDSARFRAWLSLGRVVRMTPRTLGRFQSLPDWYQLPQRDSLACTIIGNGVAVNLMTEVIKANLN